MTGPEPDLCGIAVEHDEGGPSQLKCTLFSGHAGSHSCWPASWINNRDPLGAPSPPLDEWDRDVIALLAEMRK